MGVMASQITSLTIVFIIIYSGADQRKHQSSASLAFVGNSPGIGEIPHKWPVTRKMFQFDDIIIAKTNTLAELRHVIKDHVWQHQYHHHNSIIKTITHGIEMKLGKDIKVTRRSLWLHCLQWPIPHNQYHDCWWLATTAATTWALKIKACFPRNIPISSPEKLNAIEEGLDLSVAYVERVIRQKFSWYSK